MPLLVSLCNQLHAPTHRGGLVLLDEKLRLARWVDIPQLSGSSHGCTGIERAGAVTYVLTQSQSNPSLIVFDAFFRVLESLLLTKVRDPHSLCFLDGFLYIVSTGNNSVYRLAISANGMPVGEEEPYWSYPGVPAVDADLVHLNSITAVGGELFVTCFGDKVEPSTWKTTTHGLCINISDRNAIVAEGIPHPHSVMFDGDRMLVCASAAHELLAYHAKGAAASGSTGNAFTLAGSYRFDGYLRGGDFSDEYYYLGQSGGRQISRSLGTRIAPDDATCQGARIHLLTPDLSQVVGEIDIAPFGVEIYDIHYIAALPFALAA